MWETGKLYGSIQKGNESWMTGAFVSPGLEMILMAMVWKQRYIYNLTNMNPIKKVVSCRNVSEFYLRDD